MHCLFCQSTDLRKTQTGLYHRRKTDHGPFDFYRCSNCGSGLTLPQPDPAQLSELYSHFDFGMSQLSRELLEENPEAAWHGPFVARLADLSGRTPRESFTWIDAGAGGGEMARLIAQRFPASQGIAFDIHATPPALADMPNVQWMRTNLDEEDFFKNINAKVDIVYCIGVWEHVRNPGVFIKNLLKMAKSGAIIYVEVPNYGSMASRIFGAHWPYFIPGEHLCMPTLRGARFCVDIQAHEVFGRGHNVSIHTKPILIRYGLRFALRKLGMPRLARAVPKRLACLVPSGSMEVVIRLPP